MDCPVCANTLKEVQAGDVLVNACIGGCGGIWFDHLELQQVDEPHEFFGEMLVAVPKDESVKVDLSERVSCPKCKDTVLMRHFFSPAKKIEVDECPNCAEFWLDHGELAQIRTQSAIKHNLMRTSSGTASELAKKLRSR